MRLDNGFYQLPDMLAQTKLSLLLWKFPWFPTPVSAPPNLRWSRNRPSLVL